MYISNIEHITYQCSTPLPPSLWISTDFQWIWVDFLHVDSHLYLYYLQSISRIFQVNIVEACIFRIVGSCVASWSDAIVCRCRQGVHRSCLAEISGNKSSLGNMSCGDFQFPLIALLHMCSLKLRVDRLCKVNSM